MSTDLWERVKSATTEIVTTASEKTREGIAVASRKLDIASIKRDIHREFAGLGGRVHQVLTADPPGDVAADVTVTNHLARIRELEARLEEKEQELREIRESGDAAPRGDREEPGSAPAGTATASASGSDAPAAASDISDPPAEESEGTDTPPAR